MFGGPKTTTTPPPGSGRPQAGDVAKIAGNLTHVIITDESLTGLNVFYNGQPVLTGSLENIGLEIVAPSDTDSGTITGVLTRYETSMDGTRMTKSASLFPGTIEIVAKGKRISITCAEEGSFNGLGLNFGTSDTDGYPNGVGLPANGVQSLRVVITPGLVDAKLKWSEDGREDTILP
jgi:hypothetical protein